MAGNTRYDSVQWALAYYTATAARSVGRELYLKNARGIAAEARRSVEYRRQERRAPATEPARRAGRSHGTPIRVRVKVG